MPHHPWIELRRLFVVAISNVRKWREAPEAQWARWMSFRPRRKQTGLRVRTPFQEEEGDCGVSYSSSHLGPLTNRLSRR
jgi:hypothetical protein